MPCSKETLVGLFFNITSSFKLLLCAFYFSFVLLAKLFHSFWSYHTIERSHDALEFGSCSEEEVEEEDEDEENEDEDEEEEEEEEREEHEQEQSYDGYYHKECMDNDSLVADILCGGETLSFLHADNLHTYHVPSEEVTNQHQPIFEYSDHENDLTEPPSVYASPAAESEQNMGPEIIVDTPNPKGDKDFFYDSDPYENRLHSLSTIRTKPNDPLVTNDRVYHAIAGTYGDKEKEHAKEETKFFRDEKFYIFDPPRMETKKFEVQEKDNDGIFCDSFTVGSTSKSSSEWRSSINYANSGTDDPFSSSSRRSCPKWESYTVFQKYDEEMLFLDRISAQKLYETESLRSFEVCPRSISQRIVQKLSTRTKKLSDSHRNPYYELEAAYVAQICLTWEALNWNYKNFQSLRAARRDFDPGCPAKIAQQFQQFHVLLQRYIENEPYEYGKRPEIYARMRKLAPKLLQVPEYRDTEDDPKDKEYGSRISSNLFLLILEDCIHTFMNFLKADREKRCQIFKRFFKKKHRSSVDQTLLLFVKKANTKKQVKLKDMRRGRKCFIKRSLKEGEDMEILMGLIDLKVVSRVLRMTDISEEQLHWCQEKMSRVSVSEGKLHRDSTPLFFPAH
ncbi:Protein of unknown function DUF1666 [Dillenia turbinata]|uniref:Ribosomal protein L34Ae n=1 Tax=Dillenia turbinata TaxID=194707 RepID=A0AAN8V808_9MAGN